MSLTAPQRAATAAELAANLERSGLTPADAAQRCGLSPERFAAALRVSGADPVDVWLVRDVLESAVREAGGEPVPYTVLTPAARAAAAGWFGVRDRR